MDGDLTKPQTLNKYAYVQNNPLKYIDPTGLVSVKTDEEGKTTMTIEKGDTLSQIAPMFGMDYKDLASQLGFKDPNKIQAGASYDVTFIGGFGSVWIDLGKGWEVRIDPPSAGTEAQYHRTFYKNGRYVRSFNADGTPHDSHKDNGDVPKKILDKHDSDKKWQRRVNEQNERWKQDHQNEKNQGEGSSAGNGSASSGSNHSTQPSDDITPLDQFFFTPLPYFPAIPAPVYLPTPQPIFLPI